MIIPTLSSAQRAELLGDEPPLERGRGRTPWSFDPGSMIVGVKDADGRLLFQASAPLAHRVVTAVNAYARLNALVSIYVLLYVLLGGTQTAWGPLAGATFFTLLPEVLRSALPAVKQFLAGMAGVEGHVSPPDDSWRFIILGALTVAMMVLRPEGLITRTMVERLRFRRAPEPREATA